MQNSRAIRVRKRRDGCQDDAVEDPSRMSVRSGRERVRRNMET
jgi:hypothetical protein